MRLTLKASERRDPHSAAQLSMTQCLIAVANGQAQEGTLTIYFLSAASFIHRSLSPGFVEKWNFHTVPVSSRAKSSVTISPMRPAQVAVICTNFSANAMIRFLSDSAMIKKAKSLRDLYISCFSQSFTD